MDIQYAVLSKDGGRAVNEDAVAAGKSDTRRLFILADGLGGHGLGGHGLGEAASSLAVQQAMEAFETGGRSSGELLTHCVTSAQEALLAEQRKQGRAGDMKTTAVILLLENASARWIHVGDSRLYRFEGSRLAERTLDHSVPQMLVSQGAIRERDIRFHEDRNRLTRALGTEWARPAYTLSGELALTAPASFLLCSDGFWELIDEKEMSRTLKRARSAEDWLAAMTTLVEKNGRGNQMDNYSAITVWLR